MFQSPSLKVPSRVTVRKVDYANMGFDGSRDLSSVAEDGEAVVDVSGSAAGGEKPGVTAVYVSESAIGGEESTVDVFEYATRGGEAADVADVVLSPIHEPSVEACGNFDPNDVVTHFSHSLEPNNMSLEEAGSLSTTGAKKLVQ
ncbi:hypothetical protein V6N12_034005 [Hibiscus sabdariffa]|uniref:Uncharacterized protein n=1 Tax=Hibiscus sabdariffa TaxID=183260 RepID=A0ABR2B430_9ROSI